MNWFVSITGFAAQHFAPIQIAALQAHDEHFRGSQVGGDGHIVLVAVPDGLDHLAVVPGFSGVGVGEQQHQVNFVICDPGIDLLMAALLVGKQQRNGQTGIVRDQTAGGSCGIQVMLCQNTFLSGAELHHQFLLLIVGQKRDIHSMVTPFEKLYL